MSFLNPGLLFGLFALVIPFIVLLLFRKKMVLQWAAYEWMVRAAVKKHKQNFMDDLLKLLAKLLLLLTLVLLMARPALKSSGGGSRLVVIDTTPSMATVMDNGTRLTRAQSMARGFLEQARGATAVAAFDGSLLPLAPLSDSPDPSVVDSATLTGNSGGFEQFVSSLLALENLSATPEVVFFTDAQQSDFQDPAAIRRLLEPLAPTRIILVPVDSRADIVNLGITALEPPREGYLPGRANPLHVTIRNFSDQPADAVPVVAKVEDRVQDRITLNLPPGSEQTVELLVDTPPGGASRITVELPPDLYPSDDSWRLVAAPPEQLRILAVSPAPGENPFEYDVFFQSALQAYVPDAHLVYQRVRPHQILSLRLENYDAVVTFGVPLVNQGAIPDALSQYVHGGGSLLAFSDPGLPINWEGLDTSPPPEPVSALAPDPDRLSDGVLSFMTAPGLDASRIRFLRYTPLVTGDGEGLLYLDGLPQPVVRRIERGKGRAVVAGFLPYTGHTDLVYNPNFVQFSMRLLQNALPYTGLRSYSGRQLERIEVPALEEGVRYTLRQGNDPARMLEIHRPAVGDSYLSGEPLTENVFATLRKGEEEVFELGYNLTRADSDIDASSPTELEPLLSDSLSIRADADTPAGSIRMEHAGLMALLLLMAIGFDTYAHLWRRA